MGKNRVQCGHSLKINNDRDNLIQNGPYGADGPLNTHQRNEHEKWPISREWNYKITMYVGV